MNVTQQQLDFFVKKSIKTFLQQLKKKEEGLTSKLSYQARQYLKSLKLTVVMKKEKYDVSEAFCGC